ncbi:hypothetical protein AB0953_12850 [Streptomyces sp. NPDC046866]|uniref:hypothetical protein n=1 Tax=Streptomyces sp. NPDC046866 TaxID=3154921 RepID=UPI0034530CC4
MHTTRTSTKLLLSVAGAVSAVSGCVNVTPASMQPAGAPGTTGAAPPSPGHVPRGGPGAAVPGAAVEVQAPALEALKAGPARPTASATGTGGRPPAGAPPVADVPEPRPPAGRPAEGRSRGPQRPAPEAELPHEVIDRLPVRPADVCALGRAHGRWTPDSPESRICEGVRTP